MYSMRKILLVLFVIPVVFHLQSCTKETGEDLSELSLGYNFYPLEVGKYILYNVDSIYWDDFLKAEIHHRSQMRYECVDSFLNGEGEVSYVINVTERETPTSPFVPSDVIHATISNNRLITTQSNLDIIQLTFPIENGKTWNGLAMLPLEEHATSFPERFQDPEYVFEYSNFDEEYDPGNQYYKHTVTVNHIDQELNNPEEDSTAYAYKNYSKEVYAYNVGLIYREIVYWTFQPKGPAGQSGGSGYRKGFGVTMRAIDNN